MTNSPELLENENGFQLVKAEIHRLPPQPGDVERTWADVSRARAVLGYNPSTPFEKGIEQFVRWLKTQRGI